MVLTRSQKRKKIAKKTVDKQSREDSFISYRQPIEDINSSSSENLDNCNMDQQQDGAWGGQPSQENRNTRPQSQTPGSMISYTDSTYAEDQERLMREMIGLPPRCSAPNQPPTANNLVPPAAATPITSSNLLPSAPSFVPTSNLVFSTAPTNQRLSGFPILSTPESSTDTLLKALLVKLDNGFSNLNNSLNRNPFQNQPNSELIQLTNIVSNLASQVQNLSERMSNFSIGNTNSIHESPPRNIDLGPTLYTRRSDSGSLPKDWKLKYDGDNNKLSVEFFCDQIEFLQRVNNTDWKLVIAAFPFFLEGEAAKWFFRFIKGNQIIEWKILKDNMIEHFRGSESTISLLCTIVKRRQGEREKFDDFYNDILNLKDRTQDLTNSQLLGILRENVKENIQRHLMSYETSNLSDFVNKCRTADKLLHPWLYNKNLSGRKVSEVSVELTDNSHVDYNRSMDLEAFSSRRPLQSQNFSNTKCWNCDVVGHSWQICDEPHKIFCFWCGYKNVTCKNCPVCSSSNFRPANKDKEPPPPQKH